MYRLSVYLAGELHQVVELQDRIAALMRGRRVPAEAAGYVIALAELPDPADDDAFIALVTDRASRVVVGPPELL